jgi:hypothetical protein
MALNLYIHQKHKVAQVIEVATSNLPPINACRLILVVLPSKKKKHRTGGDILWREQCTIKY